MATEEVTPEVEEEEKSDSTPAEGNESENQDDPIDWDSLEDESPNEKDAKKEGGESDADFLKRVNEAEGRNYKSVEDWQKSVKNRNDTISKLSAKKKDEAPEKTVTTPYVERILSIENPEAKYVMEEMKEEAKRRGVDVIQVWDSSKYFQKEAQTRAAENEKDNENKKRVSSPSQKVPGNPLGVDISKADFEVISKFAKRAKMPVKDFIKKMHENQG